MPISHAYVASLQDLQRFNRFFIDREEDSVIKLQALSDRIKAATETEQLQALKAELVDFHGERGGDVCMGSRLKTCLVLCGFCCSMGEYRVAACCCVGPFCVTDVCRDTRMDARIGRMVSTPTAAADIQS